MENNKITIETLKSAVGILSDAYAAIQAKRKKAQDLRIEADMEEQEADKLEKLLKSHVNSIPQAEPTVIIKTITKGKSKKETLRPKKMSFGDKILQILIDGRPRSTSELREAYNFRNPDKRINKIEEFSGRLSPIWGKIGLNREKINGTYYYGLKSWFDDKNKIMMEYYNNIRLTYES